MLILGRMPRSIQDLSAAEFPEVDPERFEQWKLEAIRAKKHVRTALIVYGVLALLLLVTGIGVLLPGIPLLVVLYLIIRKQNRLATELGIVHPMAKVLKHHLLGTELGIVHSYLEVLKLPVAPAALERMRGATKVCPACAKEIRIESRFCGACGHPFADEEIAATQAATARSADLAKAAEAARRLKEAAALRQKSIKHSARNFFIGGVLFVVLAAGMVAGAIFGPDPQYLAIFVLTMVFLVGAAACFWGVKRKRASAEKIRQEFEELVRLEENRREI
jgi:uncharacterized membrane protein YqjE